MTNTQKGCCEKCYRHWLDEGSQDCEGCGNKSCPCHTAQTPSKTVDTPSEPSMDGREDWERDFLNRLTYIRDIHDDQEDIYNREFHGTQNDVSQVIEFIKTLITTRDASVREEERQTTYNILADIIVGEAKRITELKEGGSKSAIERNMEGGIVQKMTEYIKELHHSLTPKADISKE